MYSGAHSTILSKIYDENLVNSLLDYANDLNIMKEAKHIFSSLNLQFELISALE